MRRRCWNAGGWLILVLLAGSCSGGTEPGEGATEVASVTITSPFSAILVGASVQLEATVRTGDGQVMSSPTIVWTSADPAVISVTATGLMTGKKVGTTTVTATCLGKSASLNVTVGAVPVAHVVVQPELDTVVAGLTVQLSAALTSSTDQPLTGRPVQWTSADSAIATVDGAGLVRGQQRGTVAITAASEGVSGSATVVVLPPVASVVVTPSLDTLYPGQHLQLSAEMRDSSGAVVTDLPLHWSTDLSGAVFVGSDGMVTAEIPGTASIYASLGNVADTATVVVVTVPVASLAISPVTSTIVVGGIIGIGATPYDSAGNRVLYLVPTYSASPDGIVTHDGAFFTGIAPGTVTVTATADDVQATAQLHVVTVAFSAVAAGHSHTCALTTTGAAFCWGRQYGGIPESGAPRAVSGDPVFEQIGTGVMLSCGLAAGVTSCWGTDPVTGAVLSEPTPVSGAPSFTTIAVGDTFGCGLTSGGAVYCWGANDWGQLGDGSKVASATPVAVSGGLQFVELSASRNHACARTAEGAVYCWGDVDFPAPRLVSGTIKFASITEGYCGLDAGGVAYCWNGDAAAPVPEAVPGYSFTSLAAGEVHTCGLQADGAAFCWGLNSVGQLGTGDRVESDTPRAVVGGLHFAQLTAGNSFTCGIATDGRAYCWGQGPLGTNTFNAIDEGNAPKVVLGQ